MNIYFACSITGGREFESIFQAVTAALLAGGHEVPTAHIAESDVRSREAELDPGEVFERDSAWIRQCQVLVAEVSTPSHGVGYEIAYAIGLGKPVLCLFQHGRAVSKMITGNPDPKLHLAVYTNIEDAIRQVHAFLAEQQIL